MARARASNFRLAHKFETAYGTAASGNYNQLPCKSFDLGASQALQQDNVLSAGATRDTGDPFLDTLDVRGNAVVPVDVRNFGHWLRMLFGPATVTGSANPYTHTWKSGTTAALPSASMEKQFPEASSGGIYILATGVKANELQMDFSPRGAAEATIALIGQGETKGATSSAGTLQVAGLTRYLKSQGSITRAGSALAAVTAASLRYSNGLEEVQTIRADGKIDGADEGVSTCSGRVTLRFDDQALLDQAIANTPAAMALAYTYDSNWSLTFTLPRVFFSRPAVGVSGPGGIEVSYDWQAAYDTTATCMLQTVLKSPVASY